VTILFTGKKKRNKGFTLVELSVVLFIIVLITGIVIPNFSFFKRERLSGIARNLAGFLKGIRTEAMFSNYPVRAVFNFSDKKIKPEVCRPVSEGACEWGSLGKMEFQIPKSVSIEDISVYGDRVTTGELFIPFSHTGATPPVDIHLKMGEERVTVSLNPATGEVRIIEGYNETFEVQSE